MGGTVGGGSVTRRVRATGGFAWRVAGALGGVIGAQFTVRQNAKLVVFSWHHFGWAVIVPAPAAYGRWAANSWFGTDQTMRARSTRL